MIYVTRDGSWGNAIDVMIINIEDYEDDENVKAILEEMYNGADAQKLWALFK